MHDTTHLSARKAELMIAHDLNDMIEEAINQGDYIRARRYAEAAYSVLRTYAYVSKDNEGKAPLYHTIEVAAALMDTEMLCETVERSPRLADLLTGTLDNAQSKLARLFGATYTESMPDAPKGTITSTAQEMLEDQRPRTEGGTRHAR